MMLVMSVLQGSVLDQDNSKLGTPYKTPPEQIVRSSYFLRLGRLRARNYGSAIYFHNSRLLVRSGVRYVLPNTNHGTDSITKSVAMFSAASM